MMIFTFNNIKGNKVLILPVLESVNEAKYGHTVSDGAAEE